MGLGRRGLARIPTLTRLSHTRILGGLGFAFWRHLGGVLGRLTRLLGLGGLAGARSLGSGLLLFVLDEPLRLSLFGLSGLS